DWDTGGYVLSNATFQALGGSTTTPGFSFTGDVDTGMFSSGANTIAMSTGGSERLVIDSDGNVGIGTSSPGEALSVRRSSGSAELEVVGAVSGGVEVTGNNGYAYISLWDYNASVDQRNKTIINDHGKLTFGKTDDAWS